MSPRVDFYILDTPDTTRIPHMACRVTEKAWKSGHRVFVHTGNRFTATQMDDLLWTFRAEGFVPHGIHGSVTGEEDYPVLVGTGQAPAGELDVLVNLGDGLPDFLASCERIVEIVSNEPADRTAGRQRYRSYRDQGCSLYTHNL